MYREDTKAVPKPIILPIKKDPPNTAANSPIDFKTEEKTNASEPYDSTDLENISSTKIDNEK